MNSDRKRGSQGIGLVEWRVTMGRGRGLGVGERVGGVESVRNGFSDDGGYQEAHRRRKINYNYLYYL